MQKCFLNLCFGVKKKVLKLSSEVPEMQLGVSTWCTQSMYSYAGSEIGSGKGDGVSEGSLAVSNTTIFIGVGRF